MVVWLLLYNSCNHLPWAPTDLATNLHWKNNAGCFGDDENKNKLKKKKMMWQVKSDRWRIMWPLYFCTTGKAEGNADEKSRYHAPDLVDYKFFGLPRLDVVIRVRAFKLAGDRRFRTVLSSDSVACVGVCIKPDVGSWSTMRMSHFYAIFRFQARAWFIAVSNPSMH